MHKFKHKNRRYTLPFNTIYLDNSYLELSDSNRRETKAGDNLAFVFLARNDINDYPAPSPSAYNATVYLGDGSSEVLSSVVRTDNDIRLLNAQGSGLKNFTDTYIGGITGHLDADHYSDFIRQFAFNLGSAIPVLVMPSLRIIGGPPIAATAYEEYFVGELGCTIVLGAQFDDDGYKRFASDPTSIPDVVHDTVLLYFDFYEGVFLNSNANYGWNNIEYLALNKAVYYNVDKIYKYYTNFSTLVTGAASAGYWTKSGTGTATGSSNSIFLFAIAGQSLVITRRISAYYEFKAGREYEITIFANGNNAGVTCALSFATGTHSQVINFVSGNVTVTRSFTTNTISTDMVFTLAGQGVGITASSLTIYNIVVKDRTFTEDGDHARLVNATSVLAPDLNEVIRDPQDGTPQLSAGSATNVSTRGYVQLEPRYYLKFPNKTNWDSIEWLGTVGLAIDPSNNRILVTSSGTLQKLVIKSGPTTILRTYIFDKLEGATIIPLDQTSNNAVLTNTSNNLTATVFNLEGSGKWKETDSGFPFISQGLNLTGTPKTIKPINIFRPATANWSMCFFFKHNTDTSNDDVFADAFQSETGETLFDTVGTQVKLNTFNGENVVEFNGNKWLWGFGIDNISSLVITNSNAYRNGRKLLLVANTGAPSFNFGTSSSISPPTIFNSQNNGSQFDGIVFGFSFWNRTLTDNEVKALAHVRNPSNLLYDGTPLQKGLIIYYQFQEGSFYSGTNPRITNLAPLSNFPVTVTNGTAAAPSFWDAQITGYTGTNSQRLVNVKADTVDIKDNYK